ncbi:putative glycosyltransferase EpsJ [subsurface metagenome]
MKVSLICTLKNEESSVKEFLDSLLSQSRPPDEIIMVDGGSTDKTVEIIDSYIGNGAPIKLVIKQGANIAQGRNTAIKNAKYGIIASTDAGCRIDKHWMENLIKPFEEDPGVDVASGVYDLVSETTFEKCVAQLSSGRDIDSLTAEEFLPSSRSVAFRKEAWEKVGGYPESLDYAEDTVFDLNLKKAGFNFKIAKDATVYWRVRGNLRSLFKQGYNYTKGEATAGIRGFTTTYKPILIYLSLAILLGLAAYYNLWYGAFLVIAFIAYYLARYGLPLLVRFRKVTCLYYGPAIALVTILSNTLGTVVGKVRK